MPGETGIPGAGNVDEAGGGVCGAGIGTGAPDPAGGTPDDGWRGAERMARSRSGVARRISFTTLSATALCITDFRLTSTP